MFHAVRRTYIYIYYIYIYTHTLYIHINLHIHILVHDTYIYVYIYIYIYIHTCILDYKIVSDTHTPNFIGQLLAQQGGSLNWTP